MIRTFVLLRRFEEPAKWLNFKYTGQRDGGELFLLLLLFRTSLLTSLNSARFRTLEQVRKTTKAQVVLRVCFRRAGKG